MFCPNCGKEYSDEQNFCRYCGAKLKERTEEAIETDKAEQNFSEKQQIKDTDNQEENDTLKTVYNIDLITGDAIHSAGTTSKTEANTVSEQQEKSKTKEEHKSNFAKISENEEYRKYKKELLEKKAQISDQEKEENQIKENKGEQKKISHRAIAGITLLLAGMTVLGQLLWSIEVETQINPTEEVTEPKLNIPTEEERVYTEEPEQSKEQEEPVIEAKAGIYAEKEEEKEAGNENLSKKRPETEVAKQEENQGKESQQEGNQAPVLVEPQVILKPNIQEPTLNFTPIENPE